MISALLFGVAFAALHEKTSVSVGADGSVAAPQTGGFRYIPGGPLPPGGLGPPPPVPGMEGVAYVVPAIDMACFDNSCGKKLNKLRAKAPKLAESWDCMRRTEGEDIVNCIGSVDPETMSKPEHHLFTCAMGNNCIRGAQPLEKLAPRPPDFDNAMVPEEYEDALGEALNAKPASLAEINSYKPQKVDPAIEKGLENMDKTFDKFDHKIDSHIKGLKKEEKDIGNKIHQNAAVGLEAERKKELLAIKKDKEAEVPAAFKNDDDVEPSFIQIAQDKSAGDVPFGKFASWLEDDTKPSSFIQESPNSFVEQNAAMSSEQYDQVTKKNWAAIGKAQKEASGALSSLEKRVAEAQEDMRQAKEGKNMRH